MLFAGATVCIALLGLFVLGLSFLNGVAVASALTVVLTVAAAITLLPALLGLLGVRVLSRKERRRLAEGPQDVHAGSRWLAWATLMQNRPRIFAGVALFIMLLLSIPTLSLRLGSSDSGSDPASSTTRQSYDLLAEGFGPGFNGPLLVVAQPATRPGSCRSRRRWSRHSHPRPGWPGWCSCRFRHASVEVFRVYPTTSPQSEQTTAVDQPPAQRRDSRGREDHRRDRLRRRYDRDLRRLRPCPERQAAAVHRA